MRRPTHWMGPERRPAPSMPHRLAGWRRPPAALPACRRCRRAAALPVQCRPGQPDPRMRSRGNRPGPRLASPAGKLRARIRRCRLRPPGAGVRARWKVTFRRRRGTDLGLPALPDHRILKEHLMALPFSACASRGRCSCPCASAAAVLLAAALAAGPAVAAFPVGAFVMSAPHAIAPHTIPPHAEGTPTGILPVSNGRLPPPRQPAAGARPPMPGAQRQLPRTPQPARPAGAGQSSRPAPGSGRMPAQRVRPGRPGGGRPLAQPRPRPAAQPGNRPTTRTQENGRPFRPLPAGSPPQNNRSARPLPSGDPPRSGRSTRPLPPGQPPRPGQPARPFAATPANRTGQPAQARPRPVARSPRADRPRQLPSEAAPRPAGQRQQQVPRNLRQSQRRPNYEALPDQASPRPNQNPPGSLQRRLGDQIGVNVAPAGTDRRPPQTVPAGGLPSVAPPRPPGQLQQRIPRNLRQSQRTPDVAPPGRAPQGNAGRDRGAGGGQTGGRMTTGRYLYLEGPVRAGGAQRSRNPPSGQRRNPRRTDFPSPPGS